MVDPGSSDMTISPAIFSSRSMVKGINGILKALCINLKSEEFHLI
jgi:hypothetical protein